jgi:hypothetical protein
MSFAQQTSSFFDELERIFDDQAAQRSQYMDVHHPSGPGPYSNLLTQDETPTDWRPVNEAPQASEPEVILRGVP